MQMPLLSAPDLLVLSVCLISFHHTIANQDVTIVAERLAEAGESVLLLERGIASLYTSGGDRIEPWNNTITVFDLPGNGYQLSQLDDTSFYCTDTASTAMHPRWRQNSQRYDVGVPPNSVDFENFAAGELCALLWASRFIDLLLFRMELGRRLYIR